MTSTRELLADATQTLTRAGVATPGVDAELLLAHVTGRPRALLRLDPDPVPEPVGQSFAALVSRRASRLPLQHLTGRAPFRHLDLAVGAGVFIPRPESELMVDEVIRFAERNRSTGANRLLVVDLCTGSAALALAVGTEIANCDVVAVELAPEAVGWAQRNLAAATAELTSVGSAVEVVHADATSVAQVSGRLAHIQGTADVVVTNPPYIPSGAIPQEEEVRDHDPALALYGGHDGLDVIRLLSREAALLLRPGGLLVVEHADVQGWEGARGGVPGMLRDQRATGPADGAAHPSVWDDVHDLTDLAGRPRHTCAIRAPGTTAP